MDYKTLKQQIKKTFTGLFEPEGFKAKDKPEGINLWRDRPGGRDVIIIDAANFSNIEYGMYINILLHHRQIAIVYSMALGLSKAFMENSWCLRQELPGEYAKKLSNGRVVDTGGLETWAAQCLDCYKLIDPLFFKQFVSIGDIHTALNMVPLGECRYINHPTRQAETGIIAAKLAGSSDFTSLVSSYRKTLTEMDALESFEQTAAYLQGKTTEELQALQYQSQ
jgi:hypothetical protein